MGRARKVPVGTMGSVTAPAISVLILTKNEQLDLPGALASVAWSDDVHVFDSHSTDATAEIAHAAGATAVSPDL